MEDIILEGVNALSVDVDGNITIAKNLIGSPKPALPHLAGATLTDGYDGYYADDPSKGLRMGKGSLGGFGGGKGPVRVRVLVYSVLVVCPVEVHPMQVKVVAEHPGLQGFGMVVVVLKYSWVDLEAELEWW